MLVYEKYGFKTWYQYIWCAAEEARRLNREYLGKKVFVAHGYIVLYKDLKKEV